jgi:hypothetical protein
MDKKEEAKPAIGNPYHRLHGLGTSILTSAY